MWEGAACAHFDGVSPILYILRIAWAILEVVEGAVTKQTIELLHAFVAGIILTLFIFVKTV